MLTKLFSRFLAVVFFALVTVSAQAATNLTGTITDTRGVLGFLVPVGTTFTGDFAFDGNLTSGKVILAGFCFTTTATGLPPASADCPADKSAVPILARGETTYTGDEPAPDTVYDQEGTTFDGTSGLLILRAFSPSFNATLTISVTFNEDGTGTMEADAGGLGGASGTLDWQTLQTPE